MVKILTPIDNSFILVYNNYMNKEEFEQFNKELILLANKYNLSIEDLEEIYNIDYKEHYYIKVRFSKGRSNE